DFGGHHLREVVADDRAWHHARFAVIILGVEIVPARLDIVLGYAIVFEKIYGYGHFGIIVSLDFGRIAALGLHGKGQGREVGFGRDLALRAHGNGARLVRPTKFIAGITHGDDDEGDAQERAENAEEIFDAVIHLLYAFNN